MSREKMEIGRIEDTNRTKINFKIPMKSSQKSIDSAGTSQIIETFSSPLISEPQGKIIEEKPHYNGIPKTENLLESTEKEKPFKRKLNSEMPTYAGRNVLYPEELNSLILPIFCKLCKAALNSEKSAHFHYLSKSHEKKINNWLADWSKRTGEPLPKINKDEKTISKDSEILFCKYCNVKLTSMQDAKQHYSGRKHASKINSGVSLLNANTNPNLAKNVNTLPTDIRFGIGEGFKVLENAASQSETSVTVSRISQTKEESIENTISKVELKPSTYCDICNIHTTSEQQLALHLQGTKHFKKFKEVCPEKAFAERDAHLSRNILNCRTPSGQFYCKICNITVPDDKVFSQHLVSKRHTKNLKKQNQTNEAIAKVEILK